MYIWTGPGFRSPALLFYAGPTYFEGEDDISSAETGTEVSIALSKVTLYYQTYLVCLVVATNVCTWMGQVHSYVRELEELGTQLLKEGCPILLVLHV